MTEQSSDDAPASIDLGNMIEVVVHAVGRAHNRLHGDRSGVQGKRKPPPKAYGGNIVIRAWVSPDGDFSSPSDSVTNEGD